jgi:hypothetical protein
MEIEISVVTGTYNRLVYLQKMVESVRKSIGRGIPYEIVIVDGDLLMGHLFGVNHKMTLYLYNKVSYWVL